MPETTILDIDFGSIFDELTKIKNATADLRAENDKLADSIKKDGDATGELNKQLLNNEAQLRSLSREQRVLNKVVDDSIRAEKAQKGSIEANRAELSKLTAEYIKLAKPTQEQTARIKTLSDELKKQEAALGDTRRNVGNYQSAIEGALKNVRLFGVSVGDTIGGLRQKKAELALVSNSLGGVNFSLKGITNGLKLFKIALISTGIGALIVGLGSLVTLFSKSETGLNLINKGMTIFGAVMDTLIKRVEVFAKGVFFIMSGQFGKGVDALSQSFEGLTDDIKSATVAANQLADAQKSLEDDEVDFIKRRGQITRQIAELRDTANDETKSYQERKNAIQEALVLQAELIGKENEFGARRAANAQDQFDISAQTTADLKVLNETLEDADEQAAQRLKEKKKLDNELQVLNKQIAADLLNQLVPALEKQKLVLEEISEVQVGIIDPQKLELQVKEATEVVNSATETLKDIIFSTRDEIEKEEERGGDILSFLDIDEEKLNLKLELAQQGVDAISNILDVRKENAIAGLEEQRLAEIEAVEDSIRSEQDKAAAITIINEKFNNKKIEQQKEFARKQKAIDVITAIINTALAVTNALATVKPFIPAGIAAAAVAAIAGGIQVGTIASKKFAEGGEVFDIGGKPHSQGGTKFYGEDGNVIEMEKGEKAFVLKESASDFIEKYSMINQLFGGKSWTGQPVRHAASGGQIAASFDGGFGARQSAFNVEQQIGLENLANAIRNMPVPVVRVTEINRVQKSTQSSVEVSEL